MAADDTSGARPAPVVLRIKLRYDDIETMVQRFAPNVGKSGLFLPTRSMQPVGTEVKFELRLVNDTPVLVGLGRVKLVRPPDPANPKASFGMAIELMRVSREGREVIIKMIERRRALGLPDVAIPMPEDLDAARLDTSPRVDSGGIVRASSPAMPSEQLLTAARPSAGPIAVAKTEASRPTVTALAPEPVRAKRPRIADVIALATDQSGALATIEGLDENVDVQRAMVRARALAGGDLDVELASLREANAAPIEISVEAASAELARELGGMPVRRGDRSARWAPPPNVTVAEPAPAPAPEPESEPAAEAAEARIDAGYEREPDPEPYAAANVEVITEPGTPAIEHARPQAMLIDDDADLAALEHALEGSAPAPIERDEEVEQLGDDDFELAEEEHTEIGDAPIDPNAFQAYATVPSAPTDLEASLDEQLANAEAEADSDFAIALHQAPDTVDPDATYAPPAPDDEFGEEEISELDVLAEADADDADLLNADGEADASGSHELPAAPPAYDFAARLDLGDDDAPPPSQFEEHHAGFGVPLDPAYDPPSGVYTLAESGPPDYPPEGEQFDEPHGFQSRTPVPPAAEPRMLRSQPAAADDDLETALEALDVDLDDLSIARDPARPSPRLPGLPAERPVDPPTAKPRARSARPVRPTPSRPTRAKRAETDDGVLIDFDDDDDDK